VGLDACGVVHAEARNSVNLGGHGKPYFRAGAFWGSFGDQAFTGASLRQQQGLDMMIPAWEISMHEPFTQLKVDLPSTEPGYV
jgi:hypothetical protein